MKDKYVYNQRLSLIVGWVFSTGLDTIYFFVFNKLKILVKNYLTLFKIIYIKLKTLVNLQVFAQLTCSSSYASAHIYSRYESQMKFLFNAMTVFSLKFFFYLKKQDSK